MIILPAAVRAKSAWFDRFVDTAGVPSHKAATRIISNLAEKAAYGSDPLRTESLGILNDISTKGRAELKTVSGAGVDIAFSKGGTDLLPGGIHLFFKQNSIREARKALRGIPPKKNAPIPLKA
jgi:hypothetical protein